MRLGTLLSRNWNPSRLFSPLKNKKQPICCFTSALVRRDPVQNLEESLEMLEKYYNFESAVRCLTPHTPVSRLALVSLPYQMVQFLSPYNSLFLSFRFVLFHTFLISFVVLPSHSLCFVFYLRGTRPRKSTANPEKTATEVEIISVNDRKIIWEVYGAVFLECHLAKPN